MATVYIVWDRKAQAAQAGSSASASDANNVIARIKRKNPENAGKTYDAVAVTV